MKKYFSYSDRNGYSTFETKQEAIDSAERMVIYAISGDDDSGNENELRSIEWGEIQTLGNGFLKE